MRHGWVEALCVIVVLAAFAALVVAMIAQAGGGVLNQGLVSTLGA